MSSFADVVAHAFQGLLAQGLFSIESSVYDPNAFGNAAVVLVGGNLRVRVILDRGETFAEAASEVQPDNWYPLQRIIRAVGIREAPSEGLLTPKQVAELLARYYDDLNRGLDPRCLEQTRRELAEIECAATKRMMHRVKPGRHGSAR
jgi:hypothetical protein